MNFIKEKKTDDPKTYWKTLTLPMIKEAYTEIVMRYNSHPQGRQNCKCSKILSTAMNIQQRGFSFTGKRYGNGYCFGKSCREATQVPSLWRRNFITRYLTWEESLAHVPPGKRCKNIYHYATYNSNKTGKPLCIPPKATKLWSLPPLNTLIPWPSLNLRLYLSYRWSLKNTLNNKSKLPEKSIYVFI